MRIATLIVVAISRKGVPAGSLLEPAGTPEVAAARLGKPQSISEQILVRLLDPDASTVRHRK
jgi:hypothetical protein